MYFSRLLRRLINWRQSSKIGRNQTYFEFLFTIKLCGGRLVQYKTSAALAISKWDSQCFVSHPLPACVCFNLTSGIKTTHKFRGRLRLRQSQGGGAGRSLL